MTSQTGNFQRSGRVYLMIAIAIFGTANAITRKLTDLGAANLIEGRNPISFCNVLFVGNLCALVLLSMIYHKQLRPAVWRSLRPSQWGILSLIALMSSALVPTLIFSALAITSVNNVILLGQIDTPIALALAILLLGERINKWILAGAILAFSGVALTASLQPLNTDVMGMGWQIGRGELFTLIAAILQAVSNLISKLSLQQIPLGLFNVYRTLIGTIAFFLATVMLYGPIHFIDLASPFLWQWMLLYSAIIVVGGQLAWFSGLKRSTTSEVSLATAFEPLVGILAAYLVLSEAPTMAQYIGGAVIILGIVLNQLGIQRLAQSPTPPSPIEIESTIAYKGI